MPCWLLQATSGPLIVHTGVGFTATTLVAGAAGQPSRVTLTDSVNEPTAPAFTVTVGALMELLRSEEHTSELQSPCNLVCRLLLEKKKKTKNTNHITDHSRQP